MSIVKKASIFVRQEMFKANKVKIPDVFVFFFVMNHFISYIILDC